jgi:hypothetical protein
MTKCHECDIPLHYMDSYRCRICKDYFCGDCSLEHYGMYESNGKIRYKNILKSIYWIIEGKLRGKLN